MEFVLKSLPRYNRRQHTTSEWLAKLKQRFVLPGIEEDAKKVKFCQVFIEQTGEDILAQLLDEITWEEAKRELIERLGEGIETVRKG